MTGGPDSAGRNEGLAPEGAAALSSREARNPVRTLLTLDEAADALRAFVGRRVGVCVNVPGAYVAFYASVRRVVYGRPRHLQEAAEGAWVLVTFAEEPALAPTGGQYRPGEVAVSERGFENGLVHGDLWHGALELHVHGYWITFWPGRFVWDGGPPS
jgi:hypothetical protein